MVRTPATSVRSFIATGSPANQPLLFSAPCRSCSIKALAWARALSKHNVGNALIAGSVSKIRVSAAEISSRGEISPFFKPLTTSEAVNSTKPLSILLLSLVCKFKNQFPNLKFVRFKTSKRWDCKIYKSVVVPAFKVLVDFNLY